MPQTTPWPCPLCAHEGSHSEGCIAKHLTKAPKSPTVHLNGTGWSALYGEVEAVVNAIDCAISAVRTASPNARDYYVQEPGAFSIAQGEHADRMKRLYQLKAEYELIWMAISDQERRR